MPVKPLSGYTLKTIAEYVCPVHHSKWLGGNCLQCSGERALAAVRARAASGDSSRTRRAKKLSEDLYAQRQLKERN
jgi:hypothetical protein